MNPSASASGGFALLKAAVFIDGGHLRVLAKKGGNDYKPEFVEKLAHKCIDGEQLLRILYYDCAPFSGTVKLPVSGTKHEYKGTDSWLRELARKDHFAIRRGELKFRGFKPKKTPIAPSTLTDADFDPDFEQKGVDMRLGLDIANYASDGVVDRIILLTGDTDCLPAMKHARIAGRQIVLICLPNSKPAPELLWHTDIHRTITWP